MIPELSRDHAVLAWDAPGYTGAETDLRPVLPHVDIPTLVLHGEKDARSPLANADARHAAILASQLAVTRSGHVAEDPEACNNVDQSVREEGELSSGHRLLLGQ